MYDTFLVVIPRDPKEGMPEAADEVKRLLVEISGASDARIKNYGKLQFISKLEAVAQVPLGAITQSY